MADTTMMVQTAAEIQSRPIASLKPHARNARTHSRKQIRQIADSIATFGFTNPVLIDADGGILAGHGRVEAAKLLGLAEVPCLRIDWMTDQERRAYVLADNKLALNAGWDEELLALELGALIEEVPELDIRLTGFTIAEVDEILDLGGTDATTESAEDDALPPVPEGPAVTRPGDVWRLGPNRLLCGDALEEDSYTCLLDAPAQMIFTDPPYNVPIQGHVTGKGRRRHREFAMASGEMSREEFTGFLTTVFTRLAAHSIDGSIHFVCMDWRHMPEILAAGEASYSELKNLCVWTKGQGGMGSFYRSRHELVFVFKAGTAPHVNSFELGQHGRNRTNVWSYPGVSSGTRTARAEQALHPTVKPVAMVADAMRDCSTPGGLVLDVFGGSGTTLIAAEKTRRRARLIELDPLYCDRAIERWQRFAHDDAYHEATGLTFDDLRIRREGSGDGEV